ncbi:MAG: helix-turn-helix transcriptional regulator, partial [Acidimicrobiales bacterium]
MKRTERLQALIDQLRAAGPDPTPARVLADRFEVSTRTIERDLSALQRAGEPITSVPGPGGGFTLESSRSLPPVRLTPAEAIATVAALTDDTGPFAPAAGRAREKLLAAMVDRDLELPGEIARRIRRDRTDQVTPVPAVSLALQVGMGRHEVISVRHREDGGGEAVALVEPVAVVEVDSVWHLLAWCRHHDAPWTCRI